MAKDGVYVGKLNRIGVTTGDSASTRATVIEIGEHSLADIVYNNYIRTYLSDGFDVDGAIAIAVVYNWIEGVKINGKVYRKEVSGGSGCGDIVLALTIVGIPALLIKRHRQSQIQQMLKELEAAPA